MQASFTASANYWRSYLPTKYARQPINFQENLKPAHKTTKALQVCLAQLNTLNGWDASLAANMPKGLLEADIPGAHLTLKKAMTAIRAYEFELNRALLSTLQEVPGITIFGLTDMRRLDERVATFSFRLKDQHPHEVAQKLADAGNLCLGWKLLCHQCHRTAWLGRQWRHGASRRDALQHAG